MRFSETLPGAKFQGKYLEAEYIHDLTFRIRRTVVKEIDNLVRTMGANRQDTSLPKQTTSERRVQHKDSSLLGTITFDFLTEQCDEIWHGTLWNHCPTTLSLSLQRQYQSLVRQCLSLILFVKAQASELMQYIQSKQLKTLLNEVSKFMQTNKIRRDFIDSILQILQENLVHEYFCIPRRFSRVELALHKSLLSLRAILSQSSMTCSLLELDASTSEKNQSTQLTNRIQTEYKRLQHKHYKLHLSKLVEQHISVCLENTETCLNCEMRVVVRNMDTHIKLCDSLISCRQEYEVLGEEIEAKIQDLKCLSIDIKKARSQKAKVVSDMSSKEKTNFLFRFTKSLQCKPTFSVHQQLNRKQSSDNSEEETKSQTEQAPIELENMSVLQLDRCLSIIQDIRKIRIKMKYSGSLNHPSMYVNHRAFKEQIKQKFLNFNIKCKEISDVISLLSKKLRSIHTIKKLEHRLSRKGSFKPSEFQMEFECLKLDRYSTNQSTPQLETLNEIYSDCQSSVPSFTYPQPDCSLSVKDFKVIKLLAKGRYGDVFLVRKKATGIKYAMKRIKVKYRDLDAEYQKVKNESNIFSIVNNQFLVKAVYSFTEGDFHYFVMQYAPNGDFADRLAEEARFFEYQARPLLAQIAMAINSLHDDGVIHRDIKPQNIVIDHQGHLKLTDYGLSESGTLKKRQFEAKTKSYSKFIHQQLIQKSKDNSPKSCGDKIVGSPYFMAPEVLSFMPLTKMSDWWSFGILAFQTLVGEPPFLGRNLQQISDKIVQGRVWPCQIRFGNQEDQISYQAKSLIEELLKPKPCERLGHCFSDIKEHKFFAGIDWNNLKSSPSTLFVCNQEQSLKEDKWELQCDLQKDSMEECDSETWGLESNPGLKLIRRDILSHQTNLKFQQQLGVLTRLRGVVDFLEDSKHNHV